MPSRPRRAVVDESKIGRYHVVSRCVRRARLAGVDPLTGRDFSHRKNCLRARIEALIGIFAVEALEISILDDHLHLVLRNRPDYRGALVGRRSRATVVAAASAVVAVAGAGQ